MSSIIKISTIALVVFLATDSVWIGFIASKFYKTHLGFLMKGSPNLIAALILYILLSVALSVFVIQPGLVSKNLVNTIFFGGFFGLAAYATYDLTNHATITGWPLIMTIVDILWGTFVCALTSGITYTIASKIGL